MQINEKETIASSINKTIVPWTESKTLIVFLEVISKLKVVRGEIVSITIQKSISFKLDNYS